MDEVGKQGDAMSGFSSADIAGAIAKLREGALDTNWPVTLLNMHNDVTVICDEEAAGI